VGKPIETVVGESEGLRHFLYYFAGEAVVKRVEESFGKVGAGKHCKQQLLEIYVIWLVLFFRFNYD
jgi:hypothetical protein